MKKVLFFILILIAIIGITGLVLFNWYTNASTSPASDSTQTIEFEVAEGENLNTISKSLEEKGLIKSELALKVYLRVNNLSPNIKTGVFQIPQNLTLAELIEKLESGVFKQSITVTLREALRPDQAADIIETALVALEEESLFSSEEYLNIAENPWNYEFDPEVEDFLETNKPSDKPLIGFLFPDTYNMDANTTAILLINRQISNLIDRIEQNGINLQDTTPETPTFYDVLTLASIIDKESAESDDRQLISSVFHNRLADGIPLQSDATINYITRRNDPRSTFEETKIDNPYNLYMYAGLTPTPINNPGIKSIYAAIYPKESTYYYFRHDSQANIYFSETYEQHQNSIYLYP